MELLRTRELKGADLLTELPLGPWSQSKPDQTTEPTS